MKDFRVIKMIGPFEVVINEGSSSGVHDGDKFLIYKKGEEIIDPDTSESLGFLEIICGRATAFHVQEKMSTLKSSTYTLSPEVKKTTKNFLFGPAGETVCETQERTLNAFTNISNSDLKDVFARLIK